MTSLANSTLCCTFLSVNMLTCIETHTHTQVAPKIGLLIFTKLPHNKCCRGVAIHSFFTLAPSLLRNEPTICCRRLQSAFPKAHCSEGSLFRRFIVPKVHCSEIEVHCSEGSFIRNRGSLLRRGYLENPLDPRL